MSPCERRAGDDRPPLIGGIGTYVPRVGPDGVGNPSRSLPCDGSPPFSKRGPLCEDHIQFMATGGGSIPRSTLLPAVLETLKPPPFQPSCPATQWFPTGTPQVPYRWFNMLTHRDARAWKRHERRVRQAQAPLAVLSFSSGRRLKGTPPQSRPSLDLAFGITEATQQSSLAGLKIPIAEVSLLSSDTMPAHSTQCN